MAVEKQLNTRILLKYDSYANWSSKNPVLRAGELAIATVAESHTALEGKAQHPVMFKVGPGNFNDLPWASALAADVHAWAKKSEADFKTWVKGIIEVTDINAYSKEEVDKFFEDYEAALKKYADDAVAAEAAIARAAEKANADAITVLNGEGEGSVKKAVADAKSELDGDIADVKLIADANTDAIEAINHETDGILAQAKAHTDAEIDKVEEFIGTIPETATATDIVGYIQEKTAGIATDTALEELTGRVTTAEGAIDAIEADYLKAADKTELEGKITAEAERADAAEKANAAAIKAIQDDYLKAADKTELSNAIAAEKERAEGVEAGLQTQINTIMNNPDTENVINSITEFTQYIEDHGEIAEGFRTDIDQNKADIAAEVKRAGEAESALSGRLDVLEDIDHEAYVGAIATAKSELEGKITAEQDRAEDAEEALAGRLDVVEAALGTGEGSVEDKISDAKQEAIDAAAADATTKANAAQAAAEATAAADATAKANAAQAAAEATAAADATQKANAAQAAAEATAAADAKAKADQALVDAKAYADGLAPNYATAAQGAKADSALQEITAGDGLKVTDKSKVEIDTDVVFVFNCGNASTLVD